MLKSGTGPSIQKSWFEEYRWFKLADNKKSLYCGSCYWAFQNHRLTPSEMSTCSNTTFPWKNKDDGFDNIKKGRDGIRKHADSAIHRSSESVLNTSRNLSAHRILADKSVKEEFSANRSGLKAWDSAGSKESLSVVTATMSTLLISTAWWTSLESSIRKSSSTSLRQRSIKSSRRIFKTKCYSAFLTRCFVISLTELERSRLEKQRSLFIQSLLTKQVI